jgi:hypothetical protein
MGFLKKNPERIRATREFCEILASKPDPLSMLISDIQDQEERVLWAIAGVALHQSIPLAGVAQVVCALRGEFPGLECFNLPAPREARVNKAVLALGWTRDWPMMAHVLGILTSIGHWKRKLGQEVHLALPSMDMAQAWKSLSTLYFMGKSSVVRPKVVSLLARLRDENPRGLALPIRPVPLASGNPWPWPIAPGARRWLKIFGPDPKVWMETHSEVEKFQYFQKMFSGIFPGQVAKVSYGLSFFLEPSGCDRLCRMALGGCGECPLGTMSPIIGQCPGRQV